MGKKFWRNTLRQERVGGGEEEERRAISYDTCDDASGDGIIKRFCTYSA